MPRLKRTLAALLLLSACAQVQPPPGGPPDHSAPVLLSRFPDSVRAMPGFDDWAVFQFNEVVRFEGADFGTGTSALERRILMSPDTLVPRVAWDRDRIRVQPRHGWQPGVVYRIELAPGLQDLSGNEVKGSNVITFTTGTEMPTRYISGRAVDWMRRAAIPGALIEAMTLPDSLVYRAVADSTGRFTDLGPLPNGDLLVRAIADRNNNRRLDAGEPWDSVHLAPGTSGAGEIWAFARDTFAARFTQAVRKDSNTIIVQLDLPVDPNLRLTADSIEVFRLPDSASVGPVSAMPQAIYDSLERLRAPVRPDTTPPPAAAAAATAPAVDPKQDTPRANRPVIGTGMVVQIRGSLAWATRYRIVLHGVRTLNGITGTVTGVLETPKEPEKPVVPAARPDTGRGGRGGGG